jgi:hypothetical protein
MEYDPKYHEYYPTEQEIEQMAAQQQKDSYEFYLKCGMNPAAAYRESMKEVYGPKWYLR